MKHSKIALALSSFYNMRSRVRWQMNWLTTRYFPSITISCLHLHSLKIIHCDVKPCNILLDENHRALLTDFGISVPFDEGKIGVWGTPTYLAPGQLSNERFTEKVDIFNLGIIFVEMTSGTHPFFHGATDTDGVHRNILNLNYKLRNVLHLPAVSFISRILCEEQRRFDATEALKHNFIWPYVEKSVASFVAQRKIISNETVGDYCNHTSFVRNISGLDEMMPIVTTVFVQVPAVVAVNQNVQVPAVVAVNKNTGSKQVPAVVITLIFVT